MKICPILQAGKMLSALGTRSGEYSIQGDVNFSASAHYDLPAACLLEICEWYKNGCPAYPKDGEK